MRRHPLKRLVLALLLLPLLTLALGAPAAVAEETVTDEESQMELSPLATQGPEPPPVDPVDQQALQQAIERGVLFLLDDQRPNGAWGSAEQTKGLNIYAPVPGAHHAFRAAVTGLVVEALATAQPLQSPELQSRIDQALDQAEAWMLQHLEEVRRAEPDAVYNTWGHAYAISGLVCLHRRAEGERQRQARLLDAIELQAEMLERYAFVNGGWGYYDFDYRTQSPGSSPNSFTTATALYSLKQAEELGVDFPEAEIDKAIASINRQQNPDFTYAYGEYLMMRPMYPINRAGGSLGRSQACNLALRLYGDERVTDEVLRTWLDRLFARNGWLSIGRKRPVPHESHFAVAGYFYYYGHYYAALTIELLPADDRSYFQDHMATILMPLQEKDGSWWDYPFYNYHQQYGTAMAVTSLMQCVRDPEPSATAGT